MIDTLTIKKVAGALIYSTKKESFLFLQRSKNEFLGGTCEVPSGGVELGETLQDAAVRETKEESGVSLQEPICTLSPMFYKSKSGRHTVQSNFLFVVEKNVSVFLTEDHSSYLWLSPNDLNVLDEVMKGLVLEGMGVLGI